MSGASEAIALGTQAIGAALEALQSLEVDSAGLNSSL